MPLTEKQTEYLQLCDHRWNVKTGATGSGKSYLDIAVTIPKRIMAARGEGLIVLIGNTKSTLERNILAPMRDLYGPDLVSGISNDNKVRLFGKRCYALGADNRKHVSKIQGATFEYCYGDEVTTWSEDVFQMLKSRLRCEHSHFDGTCNPDNPQHWFKGFLESDADIYQQDYVIDDGVLPANVVSELKKEYSGTVYYDRFILGRWVAAEGVCYRMFADDPEAFIIDNPPQIMSAAIGVDFGGTGSAHAFALVGFTHGYKDVIVLDEYYHENKRDGALNPAQLEAAFTDFVRRAQERYRVTAAYCDSAEQTLIQGLRAAAVRERVSVDIRNARKGSITGRIRFYNSLMAQGRFNVCRHCRATIDALRTAVWDGKSLEDKRLDNGTTNIDSLDAMEYATEKVQAEIMYLGARR